MGPGKPGGEQQCRRRFGQQIPGGPAIGYAVEIRSTVEVATLEETAALVITAHGRGEVAHTRARDSDGIRPL